MIEFTREALEKLERRYRANLINSLWGYKAAFLIGTRAPSGAENLAIFNSVVHIGSDPALVGFILRPTTVERHSYTFLKASGLFSINAVGPDQYRQAHQTSAKYPMGTSEFEATGLDPDELPEYDLPFVKGSPLWVACRYRNTYTLEENGCLLIIGSVEHIRINGDALESEGHIDHPKLGNVGVVGLDSYFEAQHLERLPYARPEPRTDGPS